MKVFGYRHHKRKERHQNELGFFPVCSRQVETPETLRYLRDDLSHPAHCFPVAPGKDLAAWKSWIAILPLPRMTRVTLISLFNELITNWAQVSFPLVPPDSQFFFFFSFLSSKGNEIICVNYCTCAGVAHSMNVTSLPISQDCGPADELKEKQLPSGKLVFWESWIYTDTTGQKWKLSLGPLEGNLSNPCSPENEGVGLSWWSTTGI